MKSALDDSRMPARLLSSLERESAKPFLMAEDLLPLPLSCTTRALASARRARAASMSDLAAVKSDSADFFFSEALASATARRA